MYERIEIINSDFFDSKFPMKEELVSGKPYIKYVEKLTERAFGDIMKDWGNNSDMLFMIIITKQKITNNLRLVSRGMNVVIYNGIGDKYDEMEKEFQKRY